MKQIILTLLTVALIASCSKSDNGDETPDGSPQPITFGSTIDLGTKAVGDADGTFVTDGEQIGVYGYRSEIPGTTPNFSPSFLSGAEFTYSTATNKFTSTNTEAFWKLGWAHNFFAYYPFGSATFIPANQSSGITAPVTVTTMTGIAEDVMTAKVETAVYNGSAKSAALTFEHRLSKVKFKLEGNAKWWFEYDELGGCPCSMLR